MKFGNKKSGFTLAEVLVTLMIIGVIAAMTIPSLMQSTSQQEYKAAFKKAVSMLNQSVTLNYALDGEDASSFTQTSFSQLLMKRLNVMTTNNSGKGIYTADGMYFYMLGEGSACNANDAMGTNNYCAKVQIDVNGQKGPNKLTEATNKVFDIFTVAVYPQKALPYGEAMSEVMYTK